MAFPRRLLIWAMTLGMTFAVVLLFVTPESFAGNKSRKPAKVSQPLSADPELEAQIEEVGKALTAIHTEIVRRKGALQQTKELSKQQSLQAQINSLQKEHNVLESILHDLVREAKATQWTPIDQALQKIWKQEQWEEYQDRKREVIRDREQ